MLSDPHNLLRDAIAASGAGIGNRAQCAQHGPDFERRESRLWQVLRHGKRSSHSDGHRAVGQINPQCTIERDEGFVGVRQRMPSQVVCGWTRLNK